MAVYRYVTEATFDPFMWQALETKAKFINQVMTGDTAVRRADDFGEQTISYAEVKAIASGCRTAPGATERRLGWVGRRSADK